MYLRVSAFNWLVLFHPFPPPPRQQDGRTTTSGGGRRCYVDYESKEAMEAALKDEVF